jgi:MoaA/NifB/PqqE/SkfB family radical SAM enzyme
VTFTGGEPTRRDDLVELILYAEGLGQVTGVLTDGRRLADEHYLEALFKAGIDHFLITYIPGSEENIQGIRNAIASDVFTAIHMTLIDADAEEVMGWITKLHEMGVSAVSITTADMSEQGQDTVGVVREFAAELGMDLVWDIPAPYSRQNPIALELTDESSGAGKAWLYVEPDGDVLPEQGVNEILGNIFTDRWTQIWEKTEDIEDRGKIGS